MVTGKTLNIIILNHLENSRFETFNRKHGFDTVKPIVGLTL